MLINLYGRIQNVDKKILWLEINSFIREHNKDFIIIGGDFNTILSQEEKYGGSQQIHPALVDFKNWIEDNCLVDIPISNRKFIGTIGGNILATLPKN